MEVIFSIDKGKGYCRLSRHSERKVVVLHVEDLNGHHATVEIDEDIFFRELAKGGFFDETK